MSALCLWFQLSLPGRLPTEADEQALAAALQRDARAGDVVLLAPWWTERARLYVPPGLPVVGYQGSDSDPLERHGRVWVLAQEDLPRADFDGFMRAFGPQRTAVGEVRRFGKLSLRLFQNGRAKPVAFALSESLASAQVYLEAATGERQACTWNGTSHHCANNQDVVAEWHEIRFAPSHCIRLYPPGGATRLVVEFENPVELKGASLRGGLVWDRGYFKDARLTTAELGLDVDGKPEAFIPFTPGLFGLQTQSVGPIPRGAKIRVWSRAENPENRDLCVDAWGYGDGA